MSLSAKIREQLISSFRAELSEHIQTLTDGLLALEQDRVHGDERQSLLEDIFRAAHSLKGAARAVGVTAIEQVSHAMESVFDAMQRNAIELTPDLFTACYQSLDAIQAVEAGLEAGETTPPVEVLKAIAGLEPFQDGQRSRPSSRRQSGAYRVEKRYPAPPPEPVQPDPEPEQEPTPQTPVTGEPYGAVLHEQLSSTWRDRKDLESGTLESAPQAPVLSQPEEASPAASFTAPAQSSTEDAPVQVGASGLAGNETIRVSVSKLDALMNQLSELLAAKIRAEQQLVQMRELQEMALRWQKGWLAVRGVYNRLVRQEKDGRLSTQYLSILDAVGQGSPGSRDRVTRAHLASVEMGTGHRETRLSDLGSVRDLARDMAYLVDYVGSNQAQMQSMGALVNDMSHQYASDTTYMGMVIDDLEEEIKRVRMLPLMTITGPFGRMVRDLAQEAGKEAVFEIAGGDTELDKLVLEQIKDPLVHLLRNAVDHGIETPAQREANGKPRTATIILAAEQAGENIVVHVADDGAGLDYESIRASIARRGVLDVDSLTEADLKEAIFQAGVSTSPIITDISGRGVGLDVVRKNTEALRGTVEVHSVLGRGTTFSLVLPLRLASTRGLLVDAGGETLAIPLDNILKIERYTPKEISVLEGHDTVRYEGQPLTLVRLSDILDLPSGNGGENGEILAVVVSAAERQMAFAIDGLGDEQEMVVKALGQQLSRVGGIAGATVLGNRQVVLVLHVGDLIKLAMRGTQRSVLSALSATAAETQARGQREILVVDDSITTRTLEKNILEAAGYAVRLATDGQEALANISSEGVPDLIVTDVAMPRMTGFELTRRIKEDQDLSHVPVVLVTSLDSDRDKRHGIEVGADAYIVKSGFDQDNLLETIEQLI